MSAKFDKGHRVGIVGGRSGKGMRGEVFWIGDSRYGKGARYGVRGDDGETYWIDEQHLGAEADVPAPVLPERKEAPLEKGTRVRITRGEGAGEEGEIFWVGPSRFGQGMRYGIRGSDEETYWVDGPGCEPIEQSGAAGAPRDSSAEFRDDDAPAPSAPDGRFFDDAPPSDTDARFFDDAPPSDTDARFFDDESPFDDDEEPPF